MRIIVALLLLLASSSFAAAPSVDCTPSRIEGTEPLGVTFDCTATHDPDTADPYHDLFYWTTFGDTGAGTWSNGANASVASKNFAIGPIVAHVFESCVGSPFTVTHNVTDGTNVASATNTITVACADTTYAGSATTCYTNGSDFTGCPSGATQTGSHSDWDAAITSADCNASTKRCLFRRGDTFSASTNGTISAAGPITIGAYGSGALPIVSMSTGHTAVLVNNAAVNDLRIMDLNITGSGSAVAGQNGIGISGASPSGITVLRVTATGLGGQPVQWASGAHKVTNGIIQDSTFTDYYDGYAVQARLISGAILGNSLNPGTGTGFAPLRTAAIQRSVVAHNTATNQIVNQSVLSLRADVHTTDANDSFYVVVSDNKVTQGTAGAGPMIGVETGSSSDVRIYDFIVERNWLLSGAYTGATDCIGISVEGARITSRNNLIDLSNPTACARYGIRIRQQTGAPVPDANTAYNNTVYSSATATTYGVRMVTSAVTNARVFNTLCWFDNGTDCVLDAGTDTVTGTNSTLAQTTSTDPSFDTPLSAPSGFRIGTGSYAASGGTAIFPASNSDFFVCDDNTSNERLGAFVPRARARCRSSAGP